MKNPLTFPLILLVASLALLVTSILMTPEIEVVEDPSFDAIVTTTGTRSAPPRTEGEIEEPTANASPEVDDPFLAARDLNPGTSSTGQ